ncbi:phosphoserine phosphatase SerB [Acetobacter oeni]|uniref:Phosphoserine phosphatase n=1 Tax=Acetobacter oeni TaxID=304077 RepID=A0A511XMK6_9PROT|nr:phosphoserine phosphatase SerB [Acetobacter oeni]MBB3882003.1 phosphoserine phosphatase [Acetobacter oeni]NHO17679.1 phosphoserine phosphatase SerB [Acetobacter oeni]GBR00297.1 phosphoserine phosphatase [Acetobacter oeni LMG 21952]GEN64173.1 phosphoserine phosphatase SerB [Acetobacter oeni]
MDAILTLVANREATTLTPLDIDTVSTLSRGQRETVLSSGEAVDIACGPVSPEELDIIREALGTRPVDVLLASGVRRRKRLLVADMDSTMVASETLDDIAAEAERLRPGIGEAVAAVTRQSMNGEIDFQTSLRNRVALLEGLPASLLEDAALHMRLNEGARTLVATMNASGTVTALVSGGFTFFTSRVARLCGFSEHHANRLDISGQVLSGTVEEPILGPDAKLCHLTRIADAADIPLTDALAIGDGANDLPMLRAAGLGIAFHAKPVVRKQIVNRIDHTSLRSALFVQGYRADEFLTS